MAKEKEVKEKKPIGVHKKLNKIMGEIGVLKKDKRNSHFKYDYLSEEAIKKAVQPLLVKHGVNFQVDITSVENEGNKVTIMLDYSFTDIETGESVNGKFAGVGVDNQDKGIWKAATGAIKYILTTSFLVPTGGDAESENVEAKSVATKSTPADEGAAATRKVTMISDPQIKKIMVMLKELEKDDAWFKSWIKKESKKDLTMAEAKQYIDIMQKKLDDKELEKSPAIDSPFGDCTHCGAKEGESHAEGCDLAETQS